MVRVEVRTMMSSVCVVTRLRSVRLALVSAVALAAAGCSADVTRFDNASFNFDDPPEAKTASNEYAPSDAGQVYDQPVARTTPRGPYGAGANSVDVSALPEPTGAPSAPAYTPPPAETAKPFRTATAQAPPSAVAGYEQSAKGEQIEVQSGDTLYGISKRHSVSLSELMTVNGLTSPNLKPGQKLHLPAAGGMSTAAASKPAPRVETAAVAQSANTDMTAQADGSYTVKPGDSIYAIARANKVSFAELQSVNDITDPRKVKPGTVLKMPGSTTAVAAAAPVSETPAPVAAAPAPVTPQPAPQQVATLNTSTTDATAAATAPAKLPDTKPVEAVAPAVKSDKVAVAAPTATAQTTDTVKLRWPAQGKIIAGFGGRPDGTHNDGVNLSVPLGTDVHAAESGVVAYAGSELKGYGNLVLIRHDNGWVTAYAHNDELSVKRGDKVKRGQVIAKAGKTGTVDQPQVHFELRQGSKPVDPTPYMEQL
jgi:murein DD-endopeptidase MepM/ murein hydrolase activator NlpD